MKKKLIAFLTIQIALLWGVNAQDLTEVPSQTSQEFTVKRDSIKAYMLTCEPGKAIYELYGHSAIWIEDNVNQNDIVFNYGLFDFNTPHFIWRFSLGQTDYILGATRLNYFLEEYNERGSKVFAQQLNLSQEEVTKLYALLKENSRKENRVYRYNFLYNNCAIAALNKIEESINGAVAYSNPKEGQTFRDILTEHTCIRPWSEFAVDLVIGADADLPLNYREEAFAPLYLKELMATAIITDTAGVQRPLVLPTTELVSPDHQVDFGEPLLTPTQLFTILFMLLLLLTLTGWYMKKAFYLTDIILFSIQGLAGMVIALLFLASEHPTTHSNWLIIFLNPLPLIFLPFAIKRIKQCKISLFYIIELMVSLLFLLLSPIIPQKIETSVLIFTGCLFLRSLSTLLFVTSHQLLKIFSNTTSERNFSPLIITILLLLSATVHAATDRPPKLVVGIVIDQLDTPNMQTIMPLLKSDGLKLLWCDGYNRDNTTFDFDDTDIASAVASIYTGATPFQHGIVAERWMNRKSFMASSPLDDSAYGGINTIQHTSPQKLLASNLADEMKLTSDGRSKVCAIAAQREAAVLAAGHEADVCVWMGQDNAKWCSSDYYGSLPTWIEQLNDSVLRNSEWRPMLSSDSYIRLTGQDLFKGFKYNMRITDRQNLTTSPFANDWVTTAALTAIDGMKLGMDDTPDLLALTFYAGNYLHETNSMTHIEQQDIYLRLDQNIATLIKEINAKVGLDNVLFFVTSTGYSDFNAPDLSKTRIPTGTVNMERVTALLNLYLSAKYGSDKYVETYYKNHLYLNHRLIEDKGIAIHEIMDNSVDLLVQMSGIKNVILLRDLMSTIPDIDSAHKRNSFNNAYSGDIIIEAIPGWGITDEKEGRTDYRKPAPQAFPMILYGNKVRAEINHEPISISSLVPTLCKIIGCSTPNAVYSNPIIGLK